MRRVLFLALLLSACGGAERLRWVINTSDPATPVAIYGPVGPTMGDAGLNCLDARNALVIFILSEQPLTDGNPIIIKANNQIQSVREHFDQDGTGVSSFEIPRTSPLAQEIAGTAKEVRFQLGDRVMRLPLAKPARQVVRDCLSRP